MERQFILGEISNRVDELAMAARIDINGYAERPLIERVVFVGIAATMSGDDEIAANCEAWAKIVSQA